MNIERRYKPVYHAPKDRHTQLVDVRQINVAFEYLLAPKKSKKSNPFICIGSGHQTREFINEKLKHRLPAIPLLRDNKDLRDSLKPREKSPLFRIVASKIAFKYQDLTEQIKAAQQIDPPKYPVLYVLEQPKEGEWEASLPLTWAEYQAIVNYA